jgi:DNA-binding winged helix-turn-helix (wHTH) protein
VRVRDPNAPPINIVVNWRALLNLERRAPPAPRRGDNTRIMAAAQLSRRRNGKLVFGSCSLDRDKRPAERDGRNVPLTPRAFDVLRYLAEHAGRLVTKQELFDAVWADVFVGDAALKVCIREIRAALDDDAHKPRYIETAHRRGYRFIAR